MKGAWELDAQDVESVVLRICARVGPLILGFNVIMMLCVSYAQKRGQS